MANPAPYSDLQAALTRARAELARVASLVDDLVEDAETALGDAERDPDGHASQVIVRADDVEHYREARELLAEADEQIQQAGALLQR